MPLSQHKHRPPQSQTLTEESWQSLNKDNLLVSENLVGSTPRLLYCSSTDGALRITDPSIPSNQYDVDTNKVTDCAPGIVIYGELVRYVLGFAHIFMAMYVVKDEGGAGPPKGFEDNTKRLGEILQSIRRKRGTRGAENLCIVQRSFVRMERIRDKLQPFAPFPYATDGLVFVDKTSVPSDMVLYKW